MALEDELDLNDPEVVAMLMRQMGMGMASGNPVSTQGTYAPELTGFAYDLPSMVGGIPLSTNSKGTPNPYNVETAAKYLNYGQDLLGSGGLGNDMISWITGPQASDPSAWTARKTGVGNPLQFQGISDLATYASSNGDDWQTYLARRIASGDTPAQALTKLKKFVQGTDESGGVSPASADFLASLPSSADFSDIQSPTPPDVKTDRGFATLYSVKDMQSFADDLFKGMSKDRALQATAYQDPETGQYYSGFEMKETPQMEAARKEGLAFPTQTYDDPKTQGEYVQRLTGMSPQDTADYDTGREGYLSGLQSKINEAQAAVKKAQKDQEDLIAAWSANYTAPEKPIVGQGNALRSLPDWAQANAAAASDLVAPSAAPTIDPSWRVYSRDAQGNPTMYQTPTLALVDAKGQDTVRSPNGSLMSEIPYAPGSTGSAAAAAAPATTGAAAATLPNVRVRGDGTIELGTTPNPSALPIAGVVAKGNKLVGHLDTRPQTTLRPLTQADLGTAAETVAKRRATADAAQAAFERSLSRDETEMQRHRLMATMNYLASQGRRPLNDQLAARSQTLRNLIGA